MLGQPRGIELKRRLLVVALCAAAAWVGAGIGMPADGRYPPFPIDGNSNPTGSSNGSSSSANSGSAPEFFNPGRSGSSGSGSGSGGSSAGSNISDAGPTCSLSRSILYAGQVGGRYQVARAQELGAIKVGGVKGCFVDGSRVDVYVESTRRFLGTVHAAEDGSFLGDYKLPSSIKAGSHHIVVAVEKRGEFRGPLLVLPRGATGAGDGAGTGASVLGSSVRNTSGGGGGILPRTGADLFRLVMWALILIGLGTLLVLATMRVSEKLAPARTSSRRTRSRRAVAALPPPEVPFVDTSRFVPYRPGTQRSASTRLATRTTRSAPQTSSRSSAPAPSVRTKRTASREWPRTPRSESPS
jgi:hypothetical protein